MANKLVRYAKMFQPSRLVGALLRRKTDWLRMMQYQPQKTTQLKNAVLFESFQGKVIGDNPWAIYRELKNRHPELTFYWTIIPGQTKAPDGSIGLAHGSRAWLEVLATAKYLVNNTNFPWYFRKVEGQVYLQTWHGTPLKRLGRDIPDNLLTSGYIATMDREALAWDYLISPSSYCSTIFPTALNHSRNIIETGYPRNDLVAQNSPELRAEIRARLGVTDPNLKLVMYAPTWRDYQRDATGKWKSVNYLGPETQLPDGFKLMFRGHTNTHAVHNSAVAGKAIDVTKYSDVAELYLAADVLITDYSSVMFDYTVTGKPIMFLAPDMQRYVQERGFYFDFVSEAPGPIFETTAQVLEQLTKLEEQKAIFASRYAAWQQKFNSLEDGHAAKRVVDIVWG